LLRQCDGAPAKELVQAAGIRSVCPVKTVRVPWAGPGQRDIALPLEGSRVLEVMEGRDQQGGGVLILGH
jgi:hypothetical protein